MINQFAYENVVTVKDLLAVVSRRVKDASKWLPRTYNLAYELPQFCAYFQQRESENLDNHWILKPWNLARSIDMTVTKNLYQIIRCRETGPKVIFLFNLTVVVYLCMRFKNQMHILNVIKDCLQIYWESSFVLSRGTIRRSQIWHKIYSTCQKYQAVSNLHL